MAVIKTKVHFEKESNCSGTATPKPELFYRRLLLVDDTHGECNSPLDDIFHSHLGDYKGEMDSRGSMRMGNPGGGGGSKFYLDQGPFQFPYSTTDFGGLIRNEYKTNNFY